MLGRTNFAQDELDAARADVTAQLAAYRSRRDVPDGLTFSSGAFRPMSLA